MDETTLLEQLRQGKLRALDTLIGRYGNYVAAVVGNIIGAAMTRPDVEKLVVFFIAVAQAQEPIAQPGEVALAVWVPMPEARKRLTYEHDREILDRAYQYLLENA